MKQIDKAFGDEVKFCSIASGLIEQRCYTLPREYSARAIRSGSDLELVKHSFY